MLPSSFVAGSARRDGEKSQLFPDGKNTHANLLPSGTVSGRLVSP